MGTAAPNIPEALTSRDRSPTMSQYATDARPILLPHLWKSTMMSGLFAAFDG
jgi:hypothetical protein